VTGVSLNSMWFTRVSRGQARQ